MKHGLGIQFEEAQGYQATGRAYNPEYSVLTVSHHLVALSHVANKLARVIYSVLKGQRPYNPQYPGAVSGV